LSEEPVKKIKLAKVLSELLDEKDITLYEIEVVLGIPTSSLHDWKVGKFPDRPSRIEKLAEYLGVSEYFLVYGEKGEKLDWRDIVEEMSLRRAENKKKVVVDCRQGELFDGILAS